MPSKLTLDVWPITSAGQAESNEDSVMVYIPDPGTARIQGTLYVVADGQGGAPRGKLASEYAARRVMHAYYTSDEPDLGLRLREAIEAANTDLYEYVKQRPELVKLGTTLTAAIVRGEQVHIASVGDSRAYLVRDGEMVQLTRDHTLVQQLVDEQAITPDEARSHPRRDVVLRQLGAEEDIRVDVFDMRLRPDDTLLLCSDGLNHTLNDEEIAGIVSTSVPRKAAETLVQKAVDRGTKGNVSVITALARDGAPPLTTPIPYQWDGQPPSFESQPSMALRSEEPEGDTTGQLPPTPRGTDPLAATQVRPSPVDEPPVGDEPGAGTLRTQPIPRPPAGWQDAPQAADESGWADATQVNPPTPPPPSRQPTDQGTPTSVPPAPVQPAPNYESTVQPAPPYGAQSPAGQPPQPPLQQPPQGGYYAQQPPQGGYGTPPEGHPYPQEQGYPQQPPAVPGQVPQYGPAVPRGYQPPPGYEYDPVTGLPPTPIQGPASPGGYQQQPPYSRDRMAPVQGQRRGIPVGLFAVVAVFSVLLTVAMVLFLINPFDWDLPQFGGNGGEQAAEETPAVADAPTEAPVEQPTDAPTPTTAPTEAPVVAPAGMVLVEDGAFVRGVPGDEADAATLDCIDEAEDNTICYPEYFQDAQPVEEITLSAFFIDVTEVTNADYAACVAAEVCTEPSNLIYYQDTAFALHPVTYVNYDQSSTYCEWAGKRLPTEAEWEKAARWNGDLGQSTTFPWGNQYDPGRANTAAAGLGGTAAVQTFTQDVSYFGVYDLTGNITEWVTDWYYPEYTGLGTLNPTGPDNQPLPEPYRVARGGNWQSIESYSRSGHRYDVPPTSSTPWLGFRCVQDVTAGGAAPAEPTEAPAEDAAAPAEETALAPTEDAGAAAAEPTATQVP